jgi:hypothetical protein
MNIRELEKKIREITECPGIENIVHILKQKNR